MPVRKNKQRLTVTLSNKAVETLEQVAQENHKTKSEILEGAFWVVITAMLDANKEEEKCN